MARRVAEPIGRGRIRAGDGKYRTELPASLRSAIDKVTKDLKGKVSMQEHRKGRKR